MHVRLLLLRLVCVCLFVVCLFLTEPYFWAFVRLKAYPTERNYAIHDIRVARLESLERFALRSFEAMKNADPSRLTSLTIALWIVLLRLMPLARE